MVFGSSWLFIVIADDIKDDVATFNNTISNEAEDSDPVQATKSFCDIIQSYADAKE